MSAAESLLLVDDNLDLSSSLKSFFEDVGFEVVLCENVADGAKVLMQRDFSACIMDMRMPGFQGPDGLKMYKKLKPSMCLFVHTGQPEYEVKEAIKGLGIPDSNLFYKPVQDLEEMAERIRAGIAKHHS